MPPAPSAGGQPQLNPQQMAALHEYIRQKKATTGGEVTAATVTEWMRAQGLGGGGLAQPARVPTQGQPLPLDPSQQQQLLMAQRQHLMQQQQHSNQPLHGNQQQQQTNIDQLIVHLFPPQLAGKQGALAHLQNILFPSANSAQNTAQNPMLAQVLDLARTQRLSQEQMGLLRTAVASRNPPPPQPAHPNTQAQYSAAQQVQMQANLLQHQQQLAAQQLAAQQQAAATHRPPPQLPSQPPPQRSNNPGEEAQRLVVTLQRRVASIEAILARADLTSEHRAKAQTELEASKTQLSNVVQSFLAQHSQNPGGGGGGGGAPIPSAASSELQKAQHAAMAQRELEIRQRGAQGPAGAAAFLQQQQKGPYRTQSPAPFPLGQPPSQHRASPAPPGYNTPANTGSPADSSNGLKKNLSASNFSPAEQQKRQQAAALAAAASQGNLNPGNLQHAHALALAQAQATALAQAQAHAQANSVMASSNGGPSNLAPQTLTSAPLIPNQLNIPPATAEAFPAPRPTLNSGLANSPSVSTPAITKHPGFGAQQVAEALRFGGGGAKKEAVLGGKDVGRSDDAASKRRTVQKRNIRELVESVDPEERLDDDVEDLLLEIADEFIDSITRFGCQLAKHRKSDRLEVKDLALHLDRSYGIKVPGFGPDETRSQSRRVNVAPGYQGRLAAVREGNHR